MAGNREPERNYQTYLTEITDKLKEKNIEAGTPEYLKELTKIASELSKTASSEDIKTIYEVADDIKAGIMKLIGDSNRQSFYSEAKKDIRDINTKITDTSNNTLQTWRATENQHNWLQFELPRIEHGTVRGAAASQVTADVVARIEGDVNLIARQYGAKAKELENVATSINTYVTRLRNGMGKDTKAQREHRFDFSRPEVNGNSPASGNSPDVEGTSNGGAGSGSASGTGSTNEPPKLNNGVPIKASDFYEASRQYEAQKKADLKAKAEEEKQANERTAKIDAAAKSIVNIIEQTVNKIISWYSDAFRNLQNTYNENFSNITTKLNLTAQKYTEIYQTEADNLRRTHLDIQFDTKDYIERLNENLNVGLRGQMAREKTLSDLILKKLIPTINTNSETYILGYKTFGENYPKIIQGMYRLNTLMGKTSEYFDSQLYASNAQQLEKMFMGMGWTEDQIANFHLAMNELTDLYGVEYVTQLSTEINKAIKSGEVTTSMALAKMPLSDTLLASLQSNSYDALNRITGASNRMMNIARGSNYTAVVANTMGEQGLIPVSADLALYGQLYGGTLSGAPASRRDLLEAAADWETQLAAGNYTSETEKFEKMFNNQQLLVNLTTSIAQNIPVKIQELIQTVQTGITSVIGSMLWNKLGGLISKALGGSGSIVGGSSGGGAGGAAASGGAAALGKSVGVLMAAAGTVWKGYDVYKSATGIYDDMKKVGGSDEYSVLRAIAGGASRLVNHSDYQLHGFKYQLENVENGAGEILSNAGQGALIGGGIGSMWGPVVGLIAGAASAIVAAGTTAVSQAIQKADMRDYLKGFSVFSEAATMASESLDSFNQSMTNLSKAEDISLKLRKDENTSLEESIDLNDLNNDDLAFLQTVYPDYFKGLDTASGLNAAYAETLELLIKEEKKKAYADLNTSYEETLAKTQEADLRTIGAAISPELYNALLGLDQGDTAGLSKVASDFGFANTAAMVDMLNRSYEGGNLINYDAFTGDWGLARNFFGNYKINEAINTSGGFSQEASEHTLLSGLTTWNELATLIEIATELSSYAPDKYLAKSAEIQVKLNDLRSLYSAIGRSDYYKSLFEGNDRTTQAIKAFNTIPDQYPEMQSLKTGLLHYQLGVQYVADKTLAVLHPGEAVSTATTVDRAVTALESLVKLETNRSTASEDQPRRSEETTNRTNPETQISVEKIIAILIEISSKLGNSPTALISALSGNGYSEDFLNFRGANLR